MYGSESKDLTFDELGPNFMREAIRVSSDSAPKATYIHLGFTFGALNVFVFGAPEQRLIAD